MPRGYHRAFHILRFGHLGLFQFRLFGWMPPLSAAQAAQIAVAKEVISDGEFMLCVAPRVAPD
jgi:hypothetical protein